MRVFLPEKRHGNEGKCWQDISNPRDGYRIPPWSSKHRQTVLVFNPHSMTAREILAIPDELIAVTNELDGRIETLAHGNEGIQNAALTATKYIFDLCMSRRPIHGVILANIISIRNRTYFKGFSRWTSDIFGFASKASDEITDKE